MTHYPTGTADRWLCPNCYVSAGLGVALDGDALARLGGAELADGVTADDGLAPACDWSAESCEGCGGEAPGTRYRVVVAAPEEAPN